MISPDNRGNGQVAAQMLAAQIPQKGVVGLILRGRLFTTNERTRQVEKWFGEHRPDVTLEKVEFIDTTKVATSPPTSSRPIRTYKACMLCGTLRQCKWRAPFAPKARTSRLSRSTSVSRPESNWRAAVW